MVSRRERLIPYVPSRLLERLAAQPDAPIPPLTPLRGSILLFDLVGSTEISTQHAAAGAAGLEALQRLLSRTYGMVVDTVHEHGGVVYQFAGDSVLAAFAVEQDDERLAAARAVACADRIERRMTELHAPPVSGGSGVQARVGVASGDYAEMLLGSPADFQVFSILGSPISMAAEAAALARPGEVAIDSATHGLLESHALDEARGSVWILRGWRGTAGVPVASSRPGACLTESALDTLASFVPPVVRDQIGGDALELSSEFREVTCVYVRFDSPEQSQPLGEVAAQTAAFYRWVQQRSRQAGGLLLEVDFTDKGRVFVVLFGAPVACEAKELTATRLAMRLALEGQEFAGVRRLRIGVATGTMYCGEVGAGARKGYAVVGSTVHTAATLTTFDAAAVVRVDEHTALRTIATLPSRLIGRVTLKGVRDPQPLFEPDSRAAVAGESPVAFTEQLIGRDGELRLLFQKLDQAAVGQGQFCMVIGEPGVGKSRLAAKLLERARAAGRSVFVGRAAAYEQHTAFASLRPIVLEIVGADANAGDDEALVRVQAALAAIGEPGSDWALVVAGALGIRCEEAAATRRLPARQRLDRTLQLMLQLVARRSTEGSMTLLFEDVHWADELSREFLKQLAARIADLPIMVVATARPEGLAGLPVDAAGVESLRLNRLDAALARELLRAHVRLEPPDPDLESLIVEKAGGNPLFLASVAQSLIEATHLRRLPSGAYKRASRIEDIAIPDRLHDLLLSRIDRLSADEKVVLKTAAVIGERFTEEAVAGLLPSSSRTMLPERLAAIVKRELIDVESDPGSFRFQHGLIRDAAYGTLPQSVRASLHRALADHLERRAGGAPESIAGLLAFHYLAGEEPGRGLQYTLMAARRAKRQHADRDACHHYALALTLVEGREAARIRAELADVHREAGRYSEAVALFQRSLDEESDREHRADVQAGLGHVYQEMGATDKSILAMETALRLSRRYVPRSRPGAVAAVVVQGVVHLCYERMPWTIRHVAGDRLVALRRQCQIFGTLQKIYFSVDLVRTAWVCLANLNLAERLGGDGDRSIAYGQYGLLPMGFGRLKTAERYLAASRDLAARAQEPVLEAIALQRSSILEMYGRDPNHGYDLAERAMAIFRRYGEMWELTFTLSIQGQHAMAAARIADADAIFRELDRLAEQLGSTAHRGRALAWLALLDYLTGREGATLTRERLRRAAAICAAAKDIAREGVTLGFLARLAVRERSPDEAATIAVETAAAIARYHVGIPTVQSCWIDAADAAMFACESGATSVPQKDLQRIVARAIRRCKRLGRKLSPVLLAQAWRVEARLLESRGKTEAARSRFREIVRRLEELPDRYELAIACRDAARVLPDEAPELRRRAETIFRELGLVRELQHS